jgi:hypothetical protein
MMLSGKNGSGLKVNTNLLVEVIESLGIGGPQLKRCRGPETKPQFENIVRLEV